MNKGFFVESGAWDGIKYSNTYNLLESCGWAGVYIEGDPERFKDLQANVPQPEIIKICQFVGTEGEASLDQILERHETPKHIDLLSIDIDSDDYAVWDSLKNFTPSVVVIEHNPTIPLDTEYVQPAGASIGNSALSNFKLGQKKGYVAVALTVTNLVFVHANLFPMLNVEKQSLDELSGPGTRFRIFYGYDGSLVHCGPKRFTGNPWQQRVNFQVMKPFRYYGEKGWRRDKMKKIVLDFLKKVCS